MKPNFKTFFTALVLSNLAMISALAQVPEGGRPPDGGPMPPPSYQLEGSQTPNPKQFPSHLGKALKLSDDQKAQIKPILDSENGQLDDLRKSADSPEQKIERIAAIEDETWAAVRPLLNQAQQKKFDSMTKKVRERRERASRDRSDDMAPPPDGPPPDGPPPGGPPPGGLPPGGPPL